MLKYTLTCLAIAVASPVAAQSFPDEYIDDRSSPERVVTSLYNAINRHEYLRGWTYFKPETAPQLADFTAGYDGTKTVELRIGTATSEGAAGSIHSMVPVALRATSEDDQVTVYTGCYRLTQVQPAMQEVPPFRPIQIDDGKLTESTQPFEDAMGECAVE